MILNNLSIFFLNNFLKNNIFYNTKQKKIFQDARKSDMQF